MATIHSPQEAHSFMGPLNGKTATFLVDGRGTNLILASSIMSLLAVTGDACAVFDLDALYASNSDTIFGPLPSSFNLSTAILVPDTNSRVENEVPHLFYADPRVVIVDSLNTFYHLLSSDGGSRTRKLSFAIASLSYLARTGRKCVIFTMYRREGFGRPGAGRSISSMSDVTASVEARDSTLSFKCERGTAWPGGRYSIRAP